MNMNVAIAVLTTFVFTSLTVSIYDYFVLKKNNKTSADNVCCMLVEMDRMCHRLGYSDIEKYMIEVYGEDEALIIGINISNTVKQLKGIKTDSNKNHYSLKYKKEEKTK